MLAKERALNGLVMVTKERADGSEDTGESHEMQKVLAYDGLVRVSKVRADNSEDTGESHGRQKVPEPDQELPSHQYSSSGMSSGTVWTDTEEGSDGNRPTGSVESGSEAGSP